MNLISCENCGVVLDKDNMEFPKDLHNDDETINDKLAVWNGNGFTAILPCPVCKESIPQDQD